MPYFFQGTQDDNHNAGEVFNAEACIMRRF